MGRQLLLVAADKMFSGVAQDKRAAGLHNGYGRIRMDKF